MALFATLSVAAAATAHGGATDAQDPVVEAEEWNYGVRCYRAGDTTNALGVFERLQDSRRRGERAAALVAKLEYDAAMADGETNGLDHLERAATAAQRVWRARPHDGRARDNYARATSGLADLRRRRREAEALARLGGIPPENAVERLLAHARANCAAVSNLPPAAAIADAEARAARARELADGYIAIREQLRQALTNEADVSVIERQTNAARENALRAARDFEDLAAGAINCAMAAEADATAWHKELCDPRAAIGAAIECETNAIAGATERYGRSTTRDALDYVEGFRRRLPAWAENYRQRAAADTNLPPFTAEAQAEADKLAAALSEQLSRLVEDFDVGDACAAESSMRRIARMLPEEKSPQSPPQQQPQPPQQQSAQAQSGNAGESKDDGEDSKQEGAQESQSPEGGEDQREKPSAAPPEPQPAPDEKELEDALKSARERSDEHRERQGKRSRGALPGERDW